MPVLLYRAVSESSAWVPERWRNHCSNYCSRAIVSGS